MASKLCSNLVLKKAKLTLFFASSSSSLLKFSEKALPQQSWRNFSFVASRRSSPILMLPPEEDMTDSAAAAEAETVNFRFFSPADKNVSKLTKKLTPPVSDANCVANTHGWLAYLHRRDCGFYLANVFSPSISPEIIPLPPPIETLPKKVTPEELLFKLILLSAPNNNSRSNICAVVVPGHLAFCRLGDTSWTRVDSPIIQKNKRKIIRDLVYSTKDQVFYALASNGDIEAWEWDLRDPSSSPKRIEIDIAYPFPNLSTAEKDMRAMCCDYKFLVESPSGDILHIVYHSIRFRPDDGTFADVFKTARFDVYKLDFELGKGEYIENLGDTALFCDGKHAYAVSVCEFPELKPNSINFANDPDDMGVYNLEDHSIAPLCPFELENIEEWTPMWIVPPNP